MMTLFAFTLLIACQGVESDVILGRDLAAADPQFAGIPADARLGYAPVPGARRTLSALDLQRIASRYNIQGEFHGVCFEYPMRQLETGEILEALRAGLNLEGAEIQIVEVSLYAAPKGDVVFPLTALVRPSPIHPEEPVIWRGYVRYATGRRFAVWAKVRLHVRETHVIAVENIPPAQIVQPSQLRVETVDGFPSFQALATVAEQVSGHTLRRAVRKDSPVLLEVVESAHGDGAREVNREVNRGDLVEVEADVGQAHLKFEGRAESGAALGEVVMVRNAKSGKAFPARVVGKGKVVVAE